MRKISLILTVILASMFVNQSFAQNGKYTSKLSELYNEEKYEEIIKFKKGKVKKFESKSLYYKGMAFYMTDNDKTALKYFDLAIDKGPADYDMYYYKARTLFFLNKSEEALPLFDQAILLLPNESAFYSGKASAYYQMEKLDSALVYFTKAYNLGDCDDIVYLSIGSINYELENYDDGIKFFKKALALVEPKSDKHRDCNFNIALGQQLGKKFEDAKKTLEYHLTIYPLDYPVISKLIQVNYALDQVDETPLLKEELFDAYKSGDLPNYMSEMYCFDQFDWNNRNILAFESYEKYENDVLIWKHKFFTLDNDEDIDIKIQTILDTLVVSDTMPDRYLLCLIQADTLYTYNHYIYYDSSDYKYLKQAVCDILNDKVKPISKMGDYSDWLDSEQQKKMGTLGSSYENAIVISSVSAEYDWLRKYYPGYDFIQQSLMFYEDKPYDVLKFRTKEGKTKEIYFDISSFYGKYF